MTMTLLLDGGLNFDEGFYPRQIADSGKGMSAAAENRDIHVISEKLAVPKVDGLLRRPRLDELVEKSLSQFGATLISGRAGTGKTALAADFANRRDNVAWYSVESADADWRIFSRYVSIGLTGELAERNSVSVNRRTNAEVSEGMIARFLADIFPKLDGVPSQKQKLFVLDDLHHLFDAPWFENFFTLLLYFLRENTQVLLLCRSRPPSPLWRLRSKQMLNVIDEKVLAFTCEETAEFFSLSGLPKNNAQKAHEDSFGRVGKVREIAGRLIGEKKLH